MCTCSNHAAAAATAAPISGSVFKVDDMTCAHCAGTIRNALREAMPGVQIDIDMEQQQVTVDGDADHAAAVIREAGYEPKLLVH